MAKASAAERLAKTPHRVGNGIKAWYERIDPETLKELEEIRTRYRAGGYQHSMSEIFEFCTRELDIPCKRQAFIRWLTETPNG